MKTYAGIGSRETPKIFLLMFYEVGAFLAKHGYTLRSGHAEGADQAFERGCDLVDGKKEIYLPWSRFEDSSSNLVVKDPAAFRIAAKFHSRWEMLSQGAQKLQARNSHQILGWALDDPCRFVICWTKDGMAGGGTGQALRIAQEKRIPVFDAGVFERAENAKRAFNDFYKQHK